MSNVGQQTAGAIPLSIAAQHLYDAECALHIAHQTRVDTWIAAASDRLHEADVEYQHAIGQSG
ncbi:hypothetical protein SAMN05892883_4194 [Jatrophihabitans sp. GAS493]|uniref:hypothetical protein n=1 Tax=Jatrophihabitans sp. GAS493 TaxID=1907575 RepID=UPI000BBFEB6A|nr:hypothetical protein [Jatrophihabitans sp. GAS493]SOD74996.1 hypothetical protein SAMN05892883_4194 [Jatrophihabitans sp. GAS493]